MVLNVWRNPGDPRPSRGAMVLASGGAGGSQLAQMVGQMVNMKYARDDELESDYLGVRLTGC